VIPPLRERRRWPIIAIAGFVLMVLVLLAQIVFALAAEPIIGRATVIDGDTIEIRGQRIRLWGVDAPEGRQSCQNAAGKNYRCGKVAADALDELLAAARPTRCEPVDIDRYKRVVARCYAGKADVAEVLIKRGLAVDYTQYSKGAYAAAEGAARSTGAGLWAGRFDKPWDWRHNR
jgi:succinoglycan biosynthesis protein ExoI